MLGCLFRRRDDLQQAVRIDALRGQHIGHGRFALRDGPCLIQHDGINGVRGFKRLAAFDEDAVLGAFSGPHHDGGRCCQPQRAGASDDEHRNEDGQREFHIPRAYVPGDAGNQGDGADDRDKVARHDIRHLRDRRFGALRVFHQLDDPGQGCIAAHLVRAETDGAV
ncbi:hypothetical protein SDC9_147959 [bioreactor metagenome]|uniref:Uncharacterized protein n=1 Tax=bioreactor metagenome TaxID=1076179 RepID=A0A645EFT0_9ZZZZ